MIDKSSIARIAKKHFPFEVPNPGQLEAIVDAVDYFINKDVSHVILEAPTGVGKSAIATTIHKTMKELNAEHRTTIITATHGLQDQYTTDVKEIVDLRGKNNYSCHLDVGPYGSPLCKGATRTNACDKATQCPYYMRREQWLKKADIRITNNAFQISAPPSLISLDETRPNLIICDESHELDDQILEHTKFVLEQKEYLELPLFNQLSLLNSIAKFTTMFGRRGIGVPFHPNREEIEKTTTLYNELVRVGASFEQLAMTEPNKYSSISESLLSLSAYFEMFTEIGTAGEWMVTEYISGERLEMKSIYAHHVSTYGLFRKAPKFLHMSATICGTKAYASTLGIKAGYGKIDVDNPIPVAQRPIVVIPEFSLGSKFDKWNDYFKLIVSVIEEHPEERGLIHSVSFDLGKRIVDAMPKHIKKRMIVTGKRNEIVDWMRANKDGIVVSPSIEKGYDFKGNLARFQILAKVPFGYLGDPHIKLNLERSSDWYARKSILRLVQASGRAVRGVDDWATTYILDGAFMRLARQNGKIFPQWYLDAIEVLGDD